MIQDTINEAESNFLYSETLIGLFFLALAETLRAGLIDRSLRWAGVLARLQPLAGSHGEGHQLQKTV